MTENYEDKGTWAWSESNLLIIEQMIIHLNRSFANDTRVVKGWVNKINNFTIPVVSVSTWDYFPNHANINIWAYSKKDRDRVTKMTVEALKKMKINNMIISRPTRIEFEEKGQLNPRNWEVVKKSKNIFRDMIMIDFEKENKEKNKNKFLSFSFKYKSR